MMIQQPASKSQSLPAGWDYPCNIFVAEKASGRVCRGQWFIAHGQARRYLHFPASRFSIWHLALRLVFRLV